MWNFHKESLYVICDIGSSTVSTGLALFARNAAPKIIYSTLVPISIANESEKEKGEAITRHLNDALKQLAGEGIRSLKKSGVKTKKIDGVHVFFASPWFSATTKETALEQKTPFIFNDSSLTDTLKNEERTFEKEITSKKNEFFDHQDIRMIEREIVSVKLNGYSTMDPFGKQARKAEIITYMSIVPEKMIKAVQTQVESHLHVENVAFHTFPLASFGGMQVIFPHDHTYAFIDVTGESTNLSFIKDGSIVSSEIIGLGRNSLIRSVMQEMKVSEDVALASLSMLKDDALRPTSEESIISAVKKMELNWKEECLRVIKDASENFGHIQNYFLIADNDVEKVFSSMLKTLKLPSGDNPIVRTLSEDLFEGKIRIEKHIRKDRFICLEALSLGRFHKSILHKFTSS